MWRKQKKDLFGAKKVIKYKIAKRNRKRVSQPEKNNKTNKTGRQLLKNRNKIRLSATAKNLTPGL